MAKSVLAAADDVRVAIVEADSHLLLHCEPDDAPELAAELGLELPATMLRSGEARGWSALHLAPDEWLLIGPEAEAADLAAAFAHAGRTVPLSLVDISDRGLAVDVGGPGAEDVLAGGCPMDLAEAAFPVGACTRTMFGKVMVMLWRRPAGFRIEYARSFHDYVVELLTVIVPEPR